MNKKYIADSNLEVLMERLSDKEEAKKAKFKKLFSVVKRIPNDVSLCGNVQVYFTNSKAKLGSYNEKATQSYEQISSQLALYRAISVFECGIDPRQGFYKRNWSITLKHEATGEYLMLGEWKGGFQIFTKGRAVKDLPKQFVKDAQAFLTWFVSSEVSIGYDGVVAGSVA